MSVLDDLLLTATQLHFPPIWGGWGSAEVHSKVCGGPQGLLRTKLKSQLPWALTLFLSQVFSSRGFNRGCSPHCLLLTPVLHHFFFTAAHSCSPDSFSQSALLPSGSQPTCLEPCPHWDEYGWGLGNKEQLEGPALWVSGKKIFPGMGGSGVRGNRKEIWTSPQTWWQSEGPWY